MTSRTIPELILAIFLTPWAGLAKSEKLPMPPTFTVQADVEQTLQAYPLGVITKQAAFSHHGKAQREVKLSNGQIGWVYDVGGQPKAVTYVSPAGRKNTVLETEMRHATRSYTLVFDNRGVVDDVLYNGDDRRDGLTALSLQHMKSVTRTEEHVQPAGR